MRRLLLALPVLLVGCAGGAAPNAAPGDTGTFADAPVPGRAPDRLPVQSDTVRTVAIAGVPDEIAFLDSLGPGCVPLGDIRARVTEPPDHGTVQLRETTGYHHALPGAATIPCNGQRVAGLQLGYVSAPAYRGPDGFAVEVVFPDGSASSIPVRVTVR